MSTNSVIRIENPRDDGVRELIAALDSYLSSLYPPESNHFLDLEQLRVRRSASSSRGAHRCARLGPRARERLRLMRLETGIHQVEAIALYRSSGYVDCDPFGQYRLDPLSRFMEKRL